MKVIRKGRTSKSVQLGEIDTPNVSSEVLAAGINPVDLAIAGGKLPFRKLDAKATLGFEGVAQTADGDVVYFSAPRPPDGSFAERVSLDGAETASVPDGLDPALAAAVGVPGIAAWSALFDAGKFAAGDRVLVLGGTGTVGRIAAQAAIAEGASLVAGTARNDEGIADLSSIGVVPVDISSASTTSTQLREASADGFDVVIDTLWGPPLAATVEHLRTGARVAQVGNSAGAETELSAPAFRNRGVTFAGHSNFLLTAEQRRVAYEKVAEYASNGKIDVPLSTIGLEEFPDFWARMADGNARGKTVLVP
ncbi:hypothetical protein D3I60_17235 [Brevibacterium permense]|uniref:quinone oxidoreductase family protein n=1 Tax=Brevibacterium permense TaxID=234834 RepID=UPI0021D2AE4D|nr:zinc-binding dehydrogenase [Brevibacterium permense]MCU4298794.1 hypothetical protein [Brevibacterium permense]